MRALLVAAALLTTSACCGGAHVAPSAGVPYRLFTHCGVKFVDYGGQRYYADPPNPPGNWDNPYDNGTLTELNPSEVTFSDPAGNRAVFSTDPMSGIPPLQPCD